MKTSICVALLVLPLGIVFAPVESSTDSCVAFWEGITPLFPGADGVGPKKTKGKPTGEKPAPTTAQQEPSAKKFNPPILTQALRWHRPSEMVLYVEDSAESPLAQGSCKSQKKSAPSGESTVTVSTEPVDATKPVVSQV